MTEQTFAPSAGIDVTKAIYAAINCNDIAAVASYLAPDIVWIEPPDFPTPGTYQGVPAVLAHITRGRSTWAEGRCHPEKFFAGGDKIVVFLHVLVRLKDHTDWIDGHMADALTFRDGRVIEVRSFGKPYDALAWAGIDASGS